MLFFTNKQSERTYLKGSPRKINATNHREVSLGRENGLRQGSPFLEFREIAEGLLWPPHTDDRDEARAGAKRWDSIRRH